MSDQMEMFVTNSKNLADSIVEKAKTVELVKQAMELTDAESQYRIPWIVFDRDKVN